uniref:Protein phosphatase 1 regulatory subunit 14B n=1 Tax=Anopheles maculatus TaxID=74869 RepID=A0A182T0B7_9DIPT
MQCGVETMNDCERSPGRTGLRVNFTEKGEVKERREKFLTAKYGSHQMSLIRKRLAVEMWLYDELQKLFDPPVSCRRATARLIPCRPLINTFNCSCFSFRFVRCFCCCVRLAEHRQKLSTWTSMRF